MNKTIEDLKTQCVELWMNDIKHGKSVDVQYKINMIVNHVSNEMASTIREEIGKLDVLPIGLLKGECNIELEDMIRVSDLDKIVGGENEVE